MSTISPDLLGTLRRWDTPTICNALEVVAPERRATGFTIAPLVCARPSLAPMVGFARTAQIRAAAPDGDTAERQREHRLEYYRYVAAGEGPTISVIQDLDHRPGAGAFWGEVNTAIHKGLGALGVITNGSIRDLDDCAPGFQLLAGQVGPSHMHVHVVAFGTPVDVHDMRTAHGDLVHADQHGAVVIPAAVAADVPDAVALVARREARVLAAARSDDFDIERLAAAMAEAADIH